MSAEPKRYSTKTKLIILLIIIASAVLLWHFFIASPKAPGASGKSSSTMIRPMGRQEKSPVQVATVTTQTVPRYLTSLGTVNAYNTVNVVSRVSGQLVSVNFEDGQQVKAGDLLAQVDPRTFQVALAQAQGQLAKDQASLNNAQKDLVRYQGLAKTNSISRQEVENQLSLVQQLEGTVKSDQGAVDSAELQLAFSSITAPISGRTGLSLIDSGNYVSSGTTNIVVINQTQPIDILFTVPEDNLIDVMKAKKSGEVVVEAWDRANKNKLAQGQLTSFDNQIDPTTGTIKLKGRFDNEDDFLFPNQFVNVKLKVDTLVDALVIPTAALQMDNQGHYVWTVDSENKASRRRVTVAIEDNQRVVISSGIEAGQRVVTDGIDQLTEGMVVEIVVPEQKSAPANNTSPVNSARPESNQGRS